MGPCNKPQTESPPPLSTPSPQPPSTARLPNAPCDTRAQSESHPPLESLHESKESKIPSPPISKHPTPSPHPASTQTNPPKAAPAKLPQSAAAIPPAQPHDSEHRKSKDQKHQKASASCWHMRSPSVQPMCFWRARPHSCLGCALGAPIAMKTPRSTEPRPSGSGQTLRFRYWSLQSCQDVLESVDAGLPGPSRAD